MTKDTTGKKKKQPNIVMNYAHFFHVCEQNVARILIGTNLRF